jgi:hypothetical protein
MAAKVARDAVEEEPGRRTLSQNPGYLQQSPAPEFRED